MENTQLARRRQTYFKLSSAIAQIDNAQLRAMLGPQGRPSSWSTNQTIDIARSKVFIKRIPLTDVEYEHMFSTSNIHDLPTYYNYGFGSAGLGVFRELVTHIKITNWERQFPAALSLPSHPGGQRTNRSRCGAARQVRRILGRQRQHWQLSA
jgi:hypothetical protein